MKEKDDVLEKIRDLLLNKHQMKVAGIAVDSLSVADKATFDNAMSSYENFTRAFYEKLLLRYAYATVVTDINNPLVTMRDYLRKSKGWSEKRPSSFK